jgi:alanine racemase
VTAGWHRPTRAVVDLGSIRHNAALLSRVVAPAELCAVVKADGYGHGAVAIATAALASGATMVAVAVVDEGMELRQAGVVAPILLLSDPADDAVPDAVANGLTLAVSTERTRRLIEDAARSQGVRAVVHLKVDTGMHRIGVSPAEVPALARAVVGSEALVLEGVFTHFPVADGASAEDRAFTAGQLSQFDSLVQQLLVSGLAVPKRHAANSAGAIAWPEARYDLVRCGIALYGELPSLSVAEAFVAATGGESLRPALTLRSVVSAVRQLPADARPSYGRARPLPGPATVATVPVGYADGVSFGLFSAGGEVLIGGRRCPLAGRVTMDQIVVDCGPDASVAVGDEVVLIGEQGPERISATDWATRLSSLSYEVLCRIGPRVPREIVGA